MVVYFSDVPVLADAKAIMAEPVGNGYYQLVAHIDTYHEFVLNPTVNLDEAKAILRHIAFRLGGHGIVEISVPELLKRLRC